MVNRFILFFNFKLLKKIIISFSLQCLNTHTLILTVLYILKCKYTMQSYCLLSFFISHRKALKIFLYSLEKNVLTLRIFISSTNLISININFVLDILHRKFTHISPISQGILIQIFKMSCNFFYINQNT